MYKQDISFWTAFYIYKNNTKAIKHYSTSLNSWSKSNLNT
ncbi:hypothetical protein BACDOR_01090 [Phocaeicola dorei DSM 17855]|uniref:Uncharacterized protein n=1 Tax=Phocaeicola dorei DSM 17855 TaxID=483217 RepID=B6VUY2_9BACT|nr:hypothetical protein BACDOR_01090 [Phocaeicola dorei DSM 17855]